LGECPQENGTELLNLRSDADILVVCSRSVLGVDDDVLSWLGYVRRVSPP